MTALGLLIMARRHGCSVRTTREYGPSSRPEFTGSQKIYAYTREHGPSSRPVFTGSRYTLPGFTGRDDGPWSRVYPACE